MKSPTDPVMGCALFRLHLSRLGVTLNISELETHLVSPLFLQLSHTACVSLDLSSCLHWTQILDRDIYLHREPQLTNNWENWQELYTVLTSKYYIRWFLNFSLVLDTMSALVVLKDATHLKRRKIRIDFFSTPMLISVGNVFRFCCDVI